MQTFIEEYKGSSVPSGIDRLESVLKSFLYSLAYDEIILYDEHTKYIEAAVHILKQKVSTKTAILKIQQANPE